MTAVDLYIVQENGPNAGFNDWQSAADAVSLVYTVPAMRFRGVPVLTNTPPRGPQRGPGQNQIAEAVEPLMDKAANQLGVDRLAIRRINAPDNTARYGANQSGVTSAYLGEALDIGGEEFDWEQRRSRSGQRNGSKVIGLGIGTAYHSAGGSGFDGLVVLTPEGKLHIHTGVGNLGTYSHTGTSRAAAEALKCDWADCVVIRGDSRNNLPWNLGQFGSNTSFTMTRSNWAGAMDAVAKLKEIAAMDLGGEPADYDIGDHRVFLTENPDQGMSYQEAARRAIELGGKFSGHEVPDDVNPRPGPLQPEWPAPASSASRETIWSTRAPWLRWPRDSSKSSLISRPASTTFSTMSASPIAARSFTRPALRRKSRAVR